MTINLRLAVMIPRCHTCEGEVMVTVDGEIIGKDVFPLIIGGVVLVNVSVNIGVCTLRCDTAGVVVEIRTLTLEVVVGIVNKRCVDTAFPCETLEGGYTDIGVEVDTRNLIVVAVITLVIEQEARSVATCYR